MAKNYKTILAEAHASDDEKWIVYDPNKSTESIDDWLEEWAPSRISRDDGIGWIAICGRNRETESQIHDVDGLMDAWKELQHSGRPINLETISELAKQYCVTCGKWIIYAGPNAKVDSYWKKVATAIVKDQLPAISAKVSPLSTDKNTHVLCIYNKDFTDEEEVCHLEHAIRKIGLKCQLVYKPDAYTYMGIYRKNKWGLRPTIYKSDYELTSGQSIIKTNSEVPRILQS
ncbi:UPF0696 protein C11orf68 homolog [Homarus americanus]|uniref:UPF0696 protein C11orf68-like n=1 Tax=Homarus americanus TaxID=6706 RepID=A0A8J5MM34_HOMAM|nr:UPF0696 protein C11orf68 homolog [Homarus americanus]KAG7156456.1 UPF0696 protein C11orf68-like [Homarus americanus]